jgi:hypothetical protein
MKPGAIVPKNHRESPVMKQKALAAALVLGLTCSSCLGPDHLYNGVKNWNAGLSKQDWVNEVVFIAMYIVPVYQIALLGDIVIFNTIDYWTGKDTLNAPGPFPGFSSKD